MRAENRTRFSPALRPVEIRATRCGLFDFLIPVLVTGIQPDQVLGLERLFRAADAALLDLCDKHRSATIKGNKLQRHYPCRSSRHKLKMNLNRP